jgi:hypothetical protein
MTVPTINNTKSRSRKTRRRPGAFKLPVVDGTCEEEIRLVSPGTELLQSNVVGTVSRFVNQKATDDVLD